VGPAASRRPPFERHTVYLCTSLECGLPGCRELARRAVARLGIDFNARSLDGRLALRPLRCAGPALGAPVVMVDEDAFRIVDAGEFDRLVEAVETGSYSQ